MEEVTINITEEVEEVTINVFEGGTIDLDDTVTDASQNAVKSSGIWAWVTGLFTAFSATLKTIATSGVHNDATERDAANSHPATAITVDETPVADFTPAVKGNNLQQVTNKVAGLQELTYRKLYEIEITDPIAFIDITKDLDGNDLDLRVGFKVSYYLLADTDALYIYGIQINGITYPVYEFSSLARNYLMYYGCRFGSSGGINLTLNGKNPDVLLHYRGEYGTSQPGTITGHSSSMRIIQDIESITSFRLLTDGYLAGSKIVIYGA